MIQLRDYQAKALDQIREEYRAGHRAVLFVLSTGGGKTITFSAMADGAAKKGKRILVLAHRHPLVHQASGTFDQLGIEHGVIMAGRSMNRLPVQIGMVQTVARRTAKLAPPDFIIIDEAHHTTAGQYRTILQAFPKARVLGVTATPARTDGTGLGDVFQAMVVGPSMRALIDQGSLADYRLFAPPQQFTLDGVHTERGDFDQRELAQRLDTSTVTGDAVAHYKRLAAGKRAIAFGISRRHIAHIAETFRAAGVPAEPIDGDMDQAERAGILGRFAAGQTLVLASCDLVSEGFDLPAVEAAIGLRPTQSLIVCLQQWGRALRPAPGKSHALILDHAGNSMRHGLPDDPREWTLEGRKRRKKKDADKIAVTTCKSCFAVFRSHLKTCPHCGEARPAQMRMLETVDGELVEVTPEMVREGELRCLPIHEALATCKTVEEIEQLRRLRGFKRGWTIHAASAALKISPRDVAHKLGFHPGYLVNAREGRAA